MSDAEKVVNISFNVKVEQSAAISMIAYDSLTKELRVQYKSGDTVYLAPNIPVEEALTILAAAHYLASWGKAVDQWTKARVAVTGRKAFPKRERLVVEPTLR